MTSPIKIESAIAANRFGLGAGTNDLLRINSDPKAWLLNQLAGPSKLPGEITSLPGSASILNEIDKIRKLQYEAKKANRKTGPEIARLGQTIRRYYMDQVSARFVTAANTDHPFHERLVHFWTNHFAVSADKPPIPALAGMFEHEAIRANISGKFSDLLLAVETHPAMLLYLDNQRSIGPNSDFGRRANRRNRKRNLGLNENLAREILELHTLGVDGGYTQEDVTSFARALTGWGIGGGRGRLNSGKPGMFHFRNEVHEPGTVKILNTSYKQKGLKQAKAILSDLASHPSTARHIARKLARHFVSDSPPSGFVDTLCRTFIDSDGDLPTLHAALVNANEPWQHPLTKYKTPEDFVISTFRAFDHVPDDTRAVFAALEMMGQTPYQPGSPAGWPDTAEQWGGADSLYKRIEWSNAFAQRLGRRANPLQLAEAVLGPVLGDHTKTAISRAESPGQGLTLLLVSPEFQRR